MKKFTCLSLVLSVLVGESAWGEKNCPITVEGKSQNVSDGAVYKGAACVDGQRYRLDVSKEVGQIEELNGKWVKKITTPGVVTTDPTVTTSEIEDQDNASQATIVTPELKNPSEIVESDSNTKKQKKAALQDASSALQPAAKLLQNLTMTKSFFKFAKYAEKKNANANTRLWSRDHTKSIAYKLKGIGTEFNCAFTLDAKVGKYDRLFKGKEQSMDEEETLSIGSLGPIKNTCSGNQLAFPEKLDLLELDINMENIVRQLTFKSDKDADGKKRQYANVQKSVISSATSELSGRLLRKPIELGGIKEINLGWFDLEPLDEGRAAVSKKRAESSIPIDCNAAARFCNNPYTFFRRLHGCPMKSLQARAMITGPLGSKLGSKLGGSCIDFAIKSSWLRTISEKYIDITILKQEELKPYKTGVKNAEIIKLNHNIVWALVMAEVLERHDEISVENRPVRKAIAQAKYTTEFAAMTELVKELKAERFTKGRKSTETESFTEDQVSAIMTNLVKELVAKEKKPEANKASTDKTSSKSDRLSSQGKAHETDGSDLYDAVHAENGAETIDGENPIASSRQ